METHDGKSAVRSREYRRPVVLGSDGRAGRAIVAVLAELCEETVAASRTELDITSEIEALRTAHNAVQEGASGVDMGRNIFQSDCPTAMIQAVGKVVHENMTPEHALEAYRSLKADAEQNRNG